MYGTHTYGDIENNASYHDRLVSELQPTLEGLYAYHATLQGIVDKLQGGIGRNGQLTDAEKEFLRPIFETVLLSGFCQQED